jgi:PAS domain S-box-containing protein
MLEFFPHLFFSFIPHGHCYFWQPQLVSLHVLSDSLVALAYYSIPVTLIYFVSHREDIPFPWIFWLFGAFIIACGTTHLMEVWTLWHPNYWSAGIIKAMTAGVSVYTAVQLVPLMPKALAMPSPTTLELINRNLEYEIQERQKIEEELRASEARYRGIVEDQTEMICRFLADGTFTFVNPAYCRYFEKTTEQLLGNTWMPIIFEEDLDYVSQQLQSLNSENPVVTVVNRVVQPSGKIRTHQWINRGIFDEKGTLTEVQAVGRDITEMKEIEEKLKAYTTQLEVSNRELQQFAFVASHDLQEPLRKIQTFGDRLQTKYYEVLSEPGRDYLERMQNAARRMRNLINDLLELSRVSTTTSKTSFNRVNLGSVVQEVLSDLEIKIEQLQAQVEVEALPILEAEPTQIRQLFQNLIDNALKFHQDERKPVIKIKAQRYLQPLSSTTGLNSQEFYQITVEDNGIGFDQKYLEKIFIPFQRLHSRHQYSGNGMGLAICRKIVEAHGGTISAKSTLNEGTLFIINLPVKPLIGEKLG